MPYLDSIGSNQSINNNKNTAQNTNQDSWSKLKDAFIKSSLDALFSSDEPEEKEPEKEQKDLSLLDSFIEECIVQPASEIIVEETGNYLTNLFAKNNN